MICQYKEKDTANNYAPKQLGKVASHTGAHVGLSVKEVTDLSCDFRKADVKQQVVLGEKDDEDSFRCCISLMCNSEINPPMRLLFIELMPWSEMVK